MVDVDEQLSLFKNGVINNLGYNGSEKKVKLNAMAFKGAFKDDKNKQGPNEVTTSDIVFHAMEAGASEEYANHLADSYKERYDAGMDPWKWKAWDQAEADLMNAKTNKLKGHTGSTENQGYKDIYKRSVTGVGHNQQAGESKDWVNKDGSVGATDYKTHTVSSNETRELFNQMGISLDQLKNVKTVDNDGDIIEVADVQNPVLIPGGKIYSPSSGRPVALSNLPYTITSIDPVVHRVDGDSYMQVSIYTDENAFDALGDEGIRSEAGLDHMNADWKQHVSKAGGGGWSGENYDVTAWIKINDSPSARKKGTNNLQPAKWQEEGGVYGTGGGDGVVKENVREFYN